MIYDLLDKASLYQADQPLLIQALNYARTVTPQTPDGRYDLQGEDLYASVASYTTTPAPTRKFEAHRKYIDLQILLTGQERLDIAVADSLKITEAYDPAKDVAFFAAPPAVSSIILRPGLFTLLYPHDAHRPGCSLTADEPVKKLVVKIRAT